MIRFNPAIGLMQRALIRYMDAECFPEDAPFSWKDAHFTIGEEHTNSSVGPACYCAWKPVEFQGTKMGFHYRAGVMPEFRGQGHQKHMIRIREQDMRNNGIFTAVTCVSTDNIASMSSLLTLEYKPYAPGKTYPNVAHDVPSVHLFKLL